MTTLVGVAYVGGPMVLVAEAEFAIFAAAVVEFVDRVGGHVGSISGHVPGGDDDAGEPMGDGSSGIYESLGVNVGTCVGHCR